MRHSTGRLSWTRSFALSGALLLTACADGGEADSAAAGNAGSPAGGSGRIDGTLTLGQRTFAFRVSSCDLSDAEAESHDHMVRGIGRIADGTPFTVIVERGLAGSTPIHSVALTYGDLMGGTGFMAEASQLKLAAGWTDETGSKAAPLIGVEGQTVRAAGTFEIDDAGAESAVEGRLEATCPRS